MKADKWQFQNGCSFICEMVSELCANQNKIITFSTYMDRETWKGKNSIPSSSLLKMAFLKVGWLKAFEKLLSDADTAFSKLI